MSFPLKSDSMFSHPPIKFNSRAMCACGRNNFEPAGAVLGISTDSDRREFANLSQMVGAEVEMSAPAGQGRGVPTNPRARCT